MSDVTSSMAAPICRFLRNDPVVRSLTFPCLSHLLSREYTYRGCDYYTVAGLIGTDKVEVYQTDSVSRAAYANGLDNKTEDYFMLSEEVVKHFDLWLSVIAHEATHMIQDFKRLKLSRQEMEMDAHFAQALYKVRSSNKADKAKGETLTYFEVAAQNYDDDPDYLPSMAFRKYRSKLESKLYTDYGKHKDFTKRKTSSGVVF